jgi:small subunit ribosomal protein S25e
VKAEAAKIMQLWQGKLTIIKGANKVSKIMGGNKKKPSGASDKNAQSGSGQAEFKSAAEKKAGSKPQQKQKLAVTIDESQGMKTIQGMKAITTQGVARNIGVKISIANAFIKSLEAKGVVKAEGGYSGHKVYQLIKR